MFFGTFPGNYFNGNNLMLSGMGLYGANLFNGNTYNFGSYTPSNSLMTPHPISGRGSKINYYTGQPVGISAPAGQAVATTIQPQFQSQVQTENVLPAIQQAAQTQNQVQVQQPVQNPVLNKKIEQDDFEPTSPAAKMLNMQLILENAKNEQGVIGKAFDKIKGLTGLGVSSKKCQQLIDSAKEGAITYEAAYEKVSKYAQKQRTAVNAFSGILAAGLAVTVASKGNNSLKIKNLLAAAGIGASVKAGVKTFDRATNNVKSDALDTKQIAKDGISGALNGSATYALSFMNAKSPVVRNSLGASVGNGAVNGLKLGASAGAVMGAGDYVIDCAFDEKQKFNGKDFVQATAYSAIAGGITGAAIGGITGGVSYNKIHPKTDTSAQRTPQMQQQQQPKQLSEPLQAEPVPQTEPIQAEPIVQTEPRVQAEPNTQTQVPVQTDSPAQVHSDTIEQVNVEPRYTVQPAQDQQVLTQPTVIEPRQKLNPAVQPEAQAKPVQIQKAAGETENIIKSKPITNSETQKQLLFTEHATAKSPELNISEDIIMPKNQGKVGNDMPKPAVLNSEKRLSLQGRIEGEPKIQPQTGKVAETETPLIQRYTPEQLKPLEYGKAGRQNYFDLKPPKSDAVSGGQAKALGEPVSHSGNIHTDLPQANPQVEPLANAQGKKGVQPKQPEASKTASVPNDKQPKVKEPKISSKKGNNTSDNLSGIYEGASKGVSNNSNITENAGNMYESAAKGINTDSVSENTSKVYEDASRGVSGNGKISDNTGRTYQNSTATASSVNNTGNNLSDMYAAGRSRADNISGNLSSIYNNPPKRGGLLGIISSIFKKK